MKIYNEKSFWATDIKYIHVIGHTEENELKPGDHLGWIGPHPAKDLIKAPCLTGWTSLFIS